MVFVHRDARETAEWPGAIASHWVPCDGLAALRNTPPDGTRIWVEREAERFDSREADGGPGG